MKSILTFLCACLLLTTAAHAGKTLVDLTLLSAGLGFVNSSYDTNGIEDGSLWIGVVGAGIQIPLSETALLRLDLDDYVYNMHWEFDGVQSEDQMQHDIVAAVGITFRTGGS